MIRFNGYKEVNNEIHLDCATWGNSGEFNNLSGLDRRAVFETLNANQHWLDIIVKQPDITKVTFSWWFAHRPRTAATIRVINDLDVMGVFIPDAAVPNHRVDVDVDNMTVIQTSGDQTYAVPITDDMLQQYEPYLRVAAAARGVLPRVNFIARHSVQKVGDFQVDFLVIEAICPLQATREGHDWPEAFKESLGSLVGDTVFVPEGNFPKGPPPEPRPVVSGIPSSVAMPDYSLVRDPVYPAAVLGNASGIPGLGSPDAPVDLTVTRRRWSTTRRTREQLVRDLNSIVAAASARSQLYLEEAFLADELITLLQMSDVRNGGEWLRNEIHDAYRILQYDRRNRVTTARPGRNVLLENLSRSEAQAAFALRQEQAMSGDLNITGDVSQISAEPAAVTGTIPPGTLVAQVAIPRESPAAQAITSGGIQGGRTTRNRQETEEYLGALSHRYQAARADHVHSPSQAAAVVSSAARSPVAVTVPPGYYHWFWPFQAAMRLALAIMRWFERRRSPARAERPSSRPPLEVILRSHFGDTITAIQTSTMRATNGQVRCQAECQVIYQPAHRLHQPGERVMDLQGDRAVARITSVQLGEARGFGMPQFLTIRLDVAPFAILQGHENDRDFDGDLN